MTGVLQPTTRVTPFFVAIYPAMCMRVVLIDLHLYSHLMDYRQDHEARVVRTRHLSKTLRSADVERFIVGSSTRST
jgi:hypothetical protein